MLNSGPRHRPRPDTSTTSEGLAPPTTSSASGNASSSSGGAVAVAAASEESSATVASKDTPVDQLLYRPELEVGSRGDIIQFYNKLFIGFIKDFVLKFSPNEPEVSSAHLQVKSLEVIEVFLWYRKLTFILSPPSALRPRVLPCPPSPSFVKQLPLPAKSPETTTSLCLLARAVPVVSRQVSLLWPRPMSSRRALPP